MRTRTSTGATRRRPKSTSGWLLSRPARVAMWAGLGAGLAFYVAFGIVPTLANVAISFTDYSGLPGSPTSWTGLQNYSTLFVAQRPGFISSLYETLYFVVGVTVVQNTLALLLAHRLQHTGRTEALVRILAFIPIVLGVTVVGIIWLLLFQPDSSPAASLFGGIGVQSAFFGSGNLAMPLVITVQVWQNLGFSMLVFIGGLKTIPTDIYEAANIDGITPWGRFRRMTWPLLAPVVTVNVLLAVIGALTTYNLIYVLTDGDNGTNTLGIFAFNTAFNSATQDLGLGAAVSSVLLVVAVLVAVPLVALLKWRERRVLA